MIVEKIYLNNFRNFKDISLDFKENINVIVGKNGIGKTNILESIYIALTASSFKSVKQDELINQNEKFLKCDILLKEQNFKNKISYYYERSRGKVFKIDDIKVKNTNELYDFSNVLVFFPDEIRIITENSIFRRNFFDSFIMKMVKGYKEKLTLYRNVIFRRNMLLKGINISSFYKDEMNALTKKAAILCYDIAIERKKMIDLINNEIIEIHKTLSKEDLFIEYESIIFDFSKGKDFNIKEILHKFSTSYAKDIENKVTNYGVHKDDFKFILNEKNARSFSSQGQKRNIIISVKMCQKNIFEKYKKIKPIILLDDLFSELDENRRFNIVDYLYNNQVIITTTDLSIINKENVNIITF